MSHDTPPTREEILAQCGDTVTKAHNRLAHFEAATTAGITRLLGFDNRRDAAAETDTFINAIRQHLEDKIVNDYLTRWHNT